MVLDMIYTNRLIVVSFKEKEDRDIFASLLDKLEIEYHEFTKEDSKYKYRLDVFY